MSEDAKQAPEMSIEEEMARKLVAKKAASRAQSEKALNSHEGTRKAQVQKAKARQQEIKNEEKTKQKRKTEHKRGDIKDKRIDNRKRGRVQAAHAKQAKKAKLKSTMGWVKPVLALVIIIGLLAAVIANLNTISGML